MEIEFPEISKSTNFDNFIYLFFGLPLFPPSTQLTISFSTLLIIWWDWTICSKYINHSKDFQLGGNMWSIDQKENLPPCLPNSIPPHAKSQHLCGASPIKIVFIEWKVLCIENKSMCATHDLYVSEIIELSMLPT